MKKIISLFFIIVCVTVSCKKPEQYPDVPTLEFKSLVFSTDSSNFSTFTLTASFTDGDGDVGYRQSDYYDPSSPYYSNFVITLFRLHNGVWTDTIEYCLNSSVVTGVYPIQTRLPYLTPTGKNKALKGDIDKTEDLPICMFDTVKFTAFIYDRALHKSNIIETPVYFVDTQ